MQPFLDQLHKKLLKSKKTVAVAESCTGGLISWLLTSKPGSSAYFIEGAVVYSNRAKTRSANVPEKLIRKEGAVSRQVAESLARGIRKASRSDIGIGSTGIAGPSGAAPGKPVGLVYISASSRKKTLVRRLLLRGGRSAIRMQAAKQALVLLKSLL